MNLRYTKRAAQDLDAILSHIDDASPQGARRVKDRLSKTIELLLQYPAAGRLTNTNQLRRITAFPYPYVVFYRIGDNDLTIHGIRHTARKPGLSTKS